MEYIYAALLLHSAKKEISEENIRKVLAAVGIEINEAKLKSLVESLKSINIDEVLSSATSFAVPMQAVPQQTSQETKKEEEKKPSSASEEQAVAGLAALFGI